MREKALETCIVLAAASLIFIELSAKKHPWGIYAALILLGISLFAKPLAVLIHRLWMGFAEKVGTVASKILLSAFFLLFLTPLALVRKTFSRSDPLRLSPPENSNLKERRVEFSKENLEKQFSICFLII